MNGGAIKAIEPAPPQTHRRWMAKRDADDMAELWSVPMPADTGTCIVTGEQSLLDYIGCELRERRRTVENRG